MSPDAWIAAPGEAAHVTRLMVAFRDHLGRTWPPDEEWRAGVERLLADPSAEFLLAGPRAEPLGVLQLRFRQGLWLAAPDACVEDLYVDAAARGRGLGRALCELAIAVAGERGCRRIELDVHERNPAALALYRSVGFVLPDPGERDILTRRRIGDWP